MRNAYTDESGAVAVIVAVFIAFATLAIAALAIDGGALFSTQRSLVTNTDAMALAGAGRLSEEVSCDGADAQDIVEAEVEEYRLANDDDLELLEPAIVECEDDGYSGSVRVIAREPSESFFSGEEDLSAAGWTEAGFTRFVEQYSVLEEEDPVISPLAFCENQFASIAGDGEGRVTVYYSPKGKKNDNGDNGKGPNNGDNGKGPNNGDDDEDDGGIPEGMLCEKDGEVHQGTNTLPGGWGWLKDSGAGWLAEKDEPDELICANAFSDTLDANWCLGRPGNSNMQSWPDLVEDREFMFPIFDEYQGQGANQGWRIVGTGVAELVGCSGSGGGNTDIGDGPFEGKCKGTPQFVTLHVKSMNVGFGPSNSVEEFFESYTDPELSITDVSSR